MSEEILNALIQLLAIIAKQDEGVNIKELEYVESFLTQQLGHEAVQDYLTQFKKKAEIGEFAKPLKKKKKLTPVQESVRTLALCRKINKTLNHSQKVVVLVRLFEMVNASRQFTEQRMAIIDTVAEVFNIEKQEYKSCEEVKPEIVAALQKKYRELAMKHYIKSFNLSPDAKLNSELIDKIFQEKKKELEEEKKEKLEAEKKRNKNKKMFK